MEQSYNSLGKTLVQIQPYHAGILLYVFFSVLKLNITIIKKYIIYNFCPLIDVFLKSRTHLIDDNRPTCPIHPITTQPCTLTKGGLQRNNAQVFNGTNSFVI